MILRKINAVISLITTVLFMDHAIFNAVWMLSRGSVEKSADFMPWVLVGFMALHAIISIELAMTAHQVVEKKDVASYPKKNVATVVQRISGMLLIVLTALHIAGTAGPLQPPQFIHAVLPVLFYIVAFAHVAISTSKALITLGVGNAKVIKAFDIIVKVICALTLVADIVGFYLYLF